MVVCGHVFSAALALCLAVLCRSIRLSGWTKPHDGVSLHPSEKPWLGGNTAHFAVLHSMWAATLLYHACNAIFAFAS